MQASQIGHLEFVRNIKEKSTCTDCGKSFPYYCLDFDHVRGEKLYSISKMVGHDRDKVRAEIEKCEIVCILCHRTRTHMRKPLPPVFSGMKLRRYNKRLKILEEINEIKKGPCVDCNKSFSYWQMEFDHRPGEVKSGSVSQLTIRLNRNRVMEEMAKCDLVCSVCHRIRTHSRGDYTKVSEAKAPTGRELWRKSFSILEKDKDAAVEMYISGVSQQDVAKFCGVTDPVVRDLLKSRGVKRRTSAKARMKLTPTQQQKAIEMYQDGMPSRKVGDKFGVTEDVVRLCLKRHGIKIRSGNDPIYNKSEKTKLRWAKLRENKTA